MVSPSPTPFDLLSFEHLGSPLLVTTRIDMRNYTVCWIISYLIASVSLPALFSKSFANMTRKVVWVARGWPCPSLVARSARRALECRVTLRNPSKNTNRREELVFAVYFAYYTCITCTDMKGICLWAAVRGNRRWSKQKAARPLRQPGLRAGGGEVRDPDARPPRNANQDSLQP